MLEDVPQEFVIVGPIVICVAILVTLVFWLGSGRQRSYEEEKALASKRADAVLKERERSQQGAGGKKKRQPFARRKTAPRGSSGEEDEAFLASKVTETLEQTRKSILKGSTGRLPMATTTPAKTVTISPELTPFKVDFDVEEITTPKPPSGKKSPLHRTLTPHPSVFKKKLPQPVSTVLEEVVEEEGEEEETKPPVVKPKISTTREDEPKPKPSAAKQASPTTPLSSKGASVTMGGGQKKRQRAKPVAEMNPTDGMPVSRISDIVGASPLSDSDIQELIEQLLEKMNANSEWQAASMRPESVKSLKKLNQDLANRLEESERTVGAHSSKIRELRAVITSERTRHQTSDGSLQAKISQQTGELTIAKTKISGLEEELKQCKADSSSHSLQQLEEKNASLQHQMATVAQQNSSLTSQLHVVTKQGQELEDVNNALKSDLHRAKEALKASADARSLNDRISDLEGIRAGLEQENQDLQATMQSINEEKMRMAAEVNSLCNIREERDGLAQKAQSLEQQLREMQGKLTGLNVEVESLRGSGAGESNGENLPSRVAELEKENAHLQSEIDELRQRSDEASVEQTQELEAGLGARQLEDAASLRAELEAKWEAEVARVRAEGESEASARESQHESEIQGLQESLLEMRKAAKEKEEELGRLLVEQEEKLQPLEVQLRQLAEQLASEQANKKDLENELESLKQVPNGPTSENGVPTEGGEKQAVVSLEVHQALIREKEEEKAAGEKEKEDLSMELQQLEKKLDELKSKNNALRDNCWKARDDAAALEKACEEKLKTAYRSAEERSKAARTKAITEIQETFKSLLLRLFPGVSAEATDISRWLDDFETEALESLQSTKNRVLFLEEKVEEIRENEQKSLQEAQHLRQTLESTMSFLTDLQSRVDSETENRQKLLEERDQMLEMEKQANRGLQEELRKERGVTSQLQKKLELGAASQEDLEKRLEDLEHNYKVAQAEAETLRHSLHHELEIKETTEQKVDKLEEEETELEERVKVVAKEKEEIAQKEQELLEEVEQLRGKLKDMEEQMQVLKLSNIEQKMADDVTPQNVLDTMAEV